MPHVRKFFGHTITRTYNSSAKSSPEQTLPQNCFQPEDSASAQMQQDRGTDPVPEVIKDHRKLSEFPQLTQTL